MTKQPNGKPLKAILVSFDDEEMQKFERVRAMLGTKSGAGTLKAAILTMHEAIGVSGEKDYMKLRDDKAFKPKLFNQMQLWSKK